MDSRPNRSRELYQARLDQTVTFISQNLDKSLDLKQVAQVSHFSPYHFHRIFTTGLGETPQDFVNRLRLEKAANLLSKSPALTITDIALTCGFSSSATFARSFKKYFGVTASEYARAGGNESQGISPSPVVEPAQLPLDIRVKLMPRLHLAYIANMKGYSLAEICRAWERLYRWALARDLLTPETKMVGLSFDDPLITPKNKCRYYACLTVPNELTQDPLVGFLDIPALKCALYRLTCKAEDIESAYRLFYRNWLPDSGFQPADYPCYELYYETPSTNAEGKFVMELCIPVMPL